MDYLKNLDFSSDEINHLGGTLPRNVIEKLKLFPRVVKTNYQILKDTGIKNYKDIFVNHTHMFFKNPDKFKAIFAKYDPKDLIRCLEKNGAIIEKL